MPVRNCVKSKLEGTTNLSRLVQLLESSVSHRSKATESLGRALLLTTLPNARLREMRTLPYLFQGQPSKVYLTPGVDFPHAERFQGSQVDSGRFPPCTRGPGSHILEEEYEAIFRGSSRIPISIHDRDDVVLPRYADVGDGRSMRLPGKNQAKP